MDNWLQELKVGDMVVVDYGGYQSAGSLARVMRLTKSLVIVGHSTHGARYKKADGRQVGSAYIGSLREATPPAVEAIEMKILADKVRFTKWLGLSRKTLEAILKLVEQERAE